MRTLNYFFVIAIVMVASGCHKQETPGVAVTSPVKSHLKTLTLTSYPNYNTSPLAPDQTGMTSTAVQLAAKMTLGINIGNTLEAPGGETGWGNPMVTQAYIDQVKRSGFNAIRIPCSWDQYLVDTTTVQVRQSWFDRVKQVIQYCVNDGMYVILNVHDGGWLQNHCTTSAQVAVNAKQKALWEQIATQMRGFDEHLLFAGTNEPDASSDEGMSVLLSYHQTFINAVRSTGGHNSYRTLVVQGPNTDMVGTNTYMNTMPTDQASGRLMVEIHNYTPYNFCLMDADASWGNMFYYWGSGYHSSADVAHNANWGEESQLSGYFQTMKTKFADHGIPVVMGEFSAERRSFLTGDALTLHLASRAYWYNYTIHQAAANGMLPFLWDIGQVIDRSTYAVKDQQQLAALVQGSQNGTLPGIQIGSVYQIFNRNSFKALEVASWGTTNGALTDQWDYLAGTNQQFKIEDAGGGYYRLIPMDATSKRLEIGGWSTANGAKLSIWDNTDGDNQKWLIQVTDNGYYKITNKFSGKVLDLGGSSLNNGAGVLQWDYNWTRNQQWGFVKI